MKSLNLLELKKYKLQLANENIKICANPCADHYSRVNVDFINLVLRAINLFVCSFVLFVCRHAMPVVAMA